MANNCFNTIIIQKNKQTRYIEELYKIIKPEVSIFKLLANIEPKDIEKETDQKWDISFEDSNAIFEDDEIIMNFDTAWGPCLGFSQKLSKLFNTEVEHSYSESGMDFGGYARYVKGKEVESREVAYLNWVYEEQGLNGLVEEFEGEEDIDFDNDRRFDFLAEEEIKELREKLKN